MASSGRERVHRLRQMLKIGVAALFPLAIASAGSAQEVEQLGASEIADNLLRVAAEYVVPQQIDRTTTLLSVEASDFTLSYFYEVNEHGSEKDLRGLFRRTNVPRICSDADVAYAFGQGVVFRYVYKIFDQPEEVVILVSAEDCPY